MNVADSMTIDAGATALKNRDYRRAEEVFKHLIAMGSALVPELVVPLARALDAQNRRDEATRYLRDALESYPESKRLHAALGDMHRFDKDYAQAIACYEASLAAAGDDLPSPEHHDFIRDNLALCYEDIGELLHAEHILRDLVCRNSSKKRYIVHLYENFIKQNKIYDALTIMEKVT